VRRMIDVFSIDGTSTSTTRAIIGANKSSRTLAGRKSTTVRTGDTILHISVTEAVNPKHQSHQVNKPATAANRKLKVFPATKLSQIAEGEHKHRITAPLHCASIMPLNH